MQNFSGEGAQLPPQTPGGHPLPTPYPPRRLDLNPPPHSEILPTLLIAHLSRWVCWKIKVTISLTDVWQQLFEQQDITVICIIHFHPWMYENHTSAVHQTLETPTETDTLKQVYQTPIGGTSMTWSSILTENVVSNQQSFIDQTID